VKLTDFGVSRQVTGCTGLTAEVGTVNWMAPEVLLWPTYDFKADIWYVYVRDFKKTQKN
jgi:serine/threonine protein kinase